MGLDAPKSRCWQGHIPSGGSKREICCLAFFPSFSKLPTSLGSWPPPGQNQQGSISLTLFLSSSSTLWPSSSTSLFRLQGHLWWHWAHPDNPVSSLHFMFSWSANLNFSSNLNSPLPWKVTYWRDHEYACHTTYDFHLQWDAFTKSSASFLAPLVETRYQVDPCHRWGPEQQSLGGGSVGSTCIRGCSGEQRPLKGGEGSRTWTEGNSKLWCGPSKGLRQRHSGTGMPVRCVPS